MPDHIDEVQRVEEMQRHEALADHHRRIDEIRSMHGRTHRAECGEEITQRRRQAVLGCQLCVSCQSDFERGGHG